MRKPDNQAVGYMLAGSALSYLLSGTGLALATLAIGLILIVLGHRSDAPLKTPEKRVFDAYGAEAKFSKESRPWMANSVLFTALLIVLVSAGVRVVRFYKNKSYISPPELAKPAPVSIYLGCSMEHIPIHIPTASTIHVIRLEPTNLKNGSNLLKYGSSSGHKFGR